MKKLAILLISLLPISTFAQKANTSVADFFKEYSEYSNYSSVEVTEDMFKMFSSMEDADEELVQFLGKLKFVRFLEYDGRLHTSIVAVTPKSGKATGVSTSAYYVDGKAVTTSVSTKRRGKKGTTVTATPLGISTGNAKIATGVSVDPTKVSNIKPIAEISNSVVYTRAMDQLNLRDFTQLMKANKDGEKMVFLKRSFTKNPNDQEFLLIQGNTMINIRGDINITHLYELEDILDAIGEILPI